MVLLLTTTVITMSSKSQYQCNEEVTYKALTFTIYPVWSGSSAQ